MEPEIYKPSIHKGAGIYNTGAEGGGGGGGNDGYIRLDIDGIEYTAVRIGNKFFTTENFVNIFSGQIEIGAPFGSSSARWVNGNESFSRENKYNLLYSIAAIDVIESNLHDGWRVCTKSDFDYIANNFGSIEKLEKWQTNDFGFSLVQNGNCEGNASFFNVGVVANMRTRTHMCNFYYNYDTAIVDRFAAIRLCKDVV